MGNQVLIFILIICIHGHVLTNAQLGPGEPLFLTPLIKKGQIDEARNLSLNNDFVPESGITSFSGFITVNEEYNSNLFFWFFPASVNSSEAPVILWNEGGPGATGMHSLFNLNGPFVVDYNNMSINLRKNSWTSTQNIIYLDNPVGVGFSFTENDAGYINSGDLAAPDIYEFLVQFFKLFPEFQTNDFYNGGVSYGALYATSVANYIHTKNEQSPEIRVNLKGLLLESPWVDPITQTDYGTYLHSVGLIDRRTKEDVDEKRDSIRELINEDKYSDAFVIWSQSILVQLTEAAGYSPMYNILKNQIDNQNFTDLVVSDSSRRSLHVGNLTFSWVNIQVQSMMSQNFMKSVKPSLETILNAGYKVLLYTGNLDTITGHLGVQQMIESLNWNGSTELANSTRNIWKVNGLISGYVNTARNFTQILMRNAGHGCNIDQPDWGLDLINRFTQDMPF